MKRIHLVIDDGVYDRKDFHNVKLAFNYHLLAERF